MSIKEINARMEEALDEGNQQAAGYYAAMLLDEENQNELCQAA
jgi:hypothetical protein